MNELSCMKVMLLGAAWARAAPSNPPMADIAEIVSTSRRDAARMMFAIAPAFPQAACLADCRCYACSVSRVSLPADNCWSQLTRNLCDLHRCPGAAGSAPVEGLLPG